MYVPKRLARNKTSTIINPFILVFIDLNVKYVPKVSTIKLPMKNMLRLTIINMRGQVTQFCHVVILLL